VFDIPGRWRARQEHIGWKLTKDLRNYYVIRQATNGVDVLIHEITTSPQIWTEKFTGLTPADGQAYKNAIAALQRVIDSSHTPEKAFGYILHQLAVPARLAVGTHFPATDDTISEALEQIQFWYPTADVTVASDLMVINVTKAAIQVRRAEVSDYSWATLNKTIVEESPTVLEVPKYSLNGVGNPYAQLDPKADVIPASAYNPS